jgi:RES domain-containing protein
MAKAWRIVSPGYASEILSGAGAAQCRGRWNRAGEQMIYTAMSQSLSMLERLVYMISPFPEMCIGTIHVPDECIELLGIKEAEIRELLVDHRNSRNMGSGWLTSNLSVALAVPSVHIHPSNWLEEPSVLINPLHPDFSKVRLLKSLSFSYDDRLDKLQGI